MEVELEKESDADEEVNILLQHSTSSDETKGNTGFSPLSKQVFAASAAILGALAAGTTSGYSAILIPQLKDTSSTIELTQEVISWIAAMSTLPLGFANILSGILMERCGRRMTQIMLAVPFIAGWIVIAVSNSLYLLLLGRFITGFCQGLHGPLGPVYIGETSAPEYRGFFLAGITFAMAFGIFLSHLLGTILSWQWTAIICSIFTFIYTISIWFCPETPSWLASKGRFVEAIESFRWLRGNRPGSNKELESLLLAQVKLKYQANTKTTTIERITYFKSTIRNQEFYKPLAIMVGFFVMSQFCGINVITFYTATIMKSVLNDGFNAYNAMIMADVFRLLMSAVTCLLSKRYGRRPLTIISGFLTMLSLFALSLYLYLFSKGLMSSELRWIPLTMIMLYIVTSSLGIIPLPWVMVGEVFPIAARGLGSGITVCIGSMAFFVTIKIAPAMFADFGMHGTFLVYGCVALVGTCALYKFLPETKGRTLQEIEDGFKSKTFK